MSTVWHVCSVVVHVNTERMAAVSDALEKLPNVEVAASDSDTGKMAVVLESDSEDTLLKHIASIRELTGVLAVSLVYHQLDEQSFDEQFFAFDEQPLDQQAQGEEIP
ncbi:chaperone NapD [Pectobacterium parmentieri]|uniref:Chaperone NapD n=1 Tax=Pectobacterium parmentieri TaxID=1905730 RepID=A0A0H3I7I7_PECPM|nr:chaperone NapD [Pectobacterium parmentieri]ACX88468.1 NapD family protein [Pectobacterium parmentieri WPP163]AFI90779.1 NapD protein [Pectobacterium parmentieri]AOR58275.1 nitrate reductase [Pectobacterium parmentieri]AYH01894.1 nitrate reductase [Pectobacterium parmentieri]AYH10713.1 nitrate reductase [Pectobacterium parmentieri]